MLKLQINDINHDEQDIFTKIARYHIEFERIHPFEDGNGRTGRLLINYELLKNDIPPIVIPKDNRTEYFKYLADRDIVGLSSFFRELSNKEKKHIEMFSFKNEEQKEKQH